MTFRRIEIMHNYFLFSLLSAISINAYATCRLENTPLTYERKCGEFMKSDGKLNYNYRQLMKHLDDISKSDLRAAQQEWINWRDEKCDEMENGCQTGSCAGVAHDICIIDLTDQRNDELMRYLSDVEYAKAKRFSFSKVYKSISNSPAR